MLQQGSKDDGTRDGDGLVDSLEKDGAAQMDSFCVDAAELVLVTDLKALCGDGYCLFVMLPILCTHVRRICLQALFRSMFGAPSARLFLT